MSSGCNSKSCKGKSDWFVECCVCEKNICFLCAGKPAKASNKLFNEIISCDEFTYTCKDCTKEKQSPDDEPAPASETEHPPNTTTNVQNNPKSTKSALKTKEAGVNKTVRFVKETHRQVQFRRSDRAELVRRDANNKKARDDAFNLLRQDFADRYDTENHHNGRFQCQQCATLITANRVCLKQHLKKSHAPPPAS